MIASTLTGKVMTWLGRLSPDIINSKKEFKKIFLPDFGAASTIMKNKTCLFEMRQKTGESIFSYITHFKKELNFVEVIEEKSVSMYFVRGLHSGPLKTQLMSWGPNNKVAMFLFTQKMALAEENKEERGNNRSRRGKEKLEDDHEEGRMIAVKVVDERELRTSHHSMQHVSTSLIS